nr:ABC transporter permease [Roseivirga sp. E12]
MFKNFIISALRSIKRQKAFSFINIIGLAVGISVSLMLFLFIQNEIQYDKFHENREDIFRVVSRYTTTKGNTNSSAITFGSVVPEMVKAIPEIQYATRIYNFGNVEISLNQTKFKDQTMYFSDHDFFEIFSFKPLYSQQISETAFGNNGVVVSAILAKTLFGDSSPIGEVIKILEQDYTIVSVVDVPKKSHLKFDLIVSLNGFPDLHDWAYKSGLDFHSYGMYADGVDHSTVDTKICELYNDQMDQRFADFTSASDNYVQPFNDIYLNSQGIANNIKVGSRQTMYVLTGINILILLIAIINYVNLTTAQYEKRIKEIGVRKVIGANRNSLIVQFLGESTVITLLAFAIALGITQFLIEPFGKIMQIEAEVTYWSQPLVILGMVCAVILIGIISGIYPALFISKFKPSKILKKDFSSLKRGTIGSKVLVTLQFVIAIVLVINFTFIHKQISYIKNIDLGFSKDQILVVNNLSTKIRSSYETVEAEILNSPNVLELTSSQSALGRGSSGQTAHLASESPNTAQPIGELRTGHNFIKTYGLEITEGRDFSKNLLTDKDAFLINESGKKLLFAGEESPVGKSIVVAGRKGQVIGVVKDFNYTNLKRQISPVVISLGSPYRLELSLKINTSNIQETIAHVESSLKKVDPDYEIGYYFLDDYFNNMFEADERNASLISYASILTILISLVGLVALIGHGLTKRMKEVAIRKVLGAKIKQILWGLIKEYYWIIIISNILAIPLALVAMNKWLPTFAYRIDPADYWMLFVKISCLSLLLALVIILIQVYKRSRMNPVEILGNE